MPNPELPGIRGFSQNTTSTPQLEDRQRAMYSGQLNPAVQHMYSLVLFDTRTGSVLQNGKLDPSESRRTAEFFFSVPPKTHEMVEPYATSIVPTQNGGKFIESHGSILKTVKLAGTTGLRPNPKRGQFRNIPVFGTAIDVLSDNLDILAGEGLLLQDRQIPEDEVTGYDDIIFLRNIFRFYSDIKERDRNAGDVVMLWRNAKDAEYWVVEPLEFQLKQDSNSPLTYNYNIQLKTLAKFDARILFFEEDPLELVRSTNRLFSRIQEYSQSIRRFALVVSTQITRLEGYGVFAMTQLVKPAIELLNGLALVKSTQTAFGERLTRTAKELNSQIDLALDKLEGEDLAPRYEIKRELIRGKVLSARLLTEPSLKANIASTLGNKRSRLVQAYNRSGGSFERSRNAPETGGSSTFLGNEPLTNTVSQSLVHEGEDIRAVAGRLLGDRGRWHVLVTLNDLKAPYISKAGGEGVLKPGEAILYPERTSSGVDSAGLVGGGNPSDKETEIADESLYGPLQQAYGRDLRLKSTSDASAGVDLTDLTINQSGDISTISGIPNVDQAIRIKFSTEAGELPVHPRFGARFPIGSKASNVAFNEFRIQTEATILSDKRVASIENLRFTTFGDAMVLNTNLRMLGTSEALNTSLALRRF